MLTELSIKNFALIESLHVSFEKGLTTITGETGAGKSLLLGALGLLLGRRADLSVIKDNTVKCVIEGTFMISDYQLESFFEGEGLDYEEETIIRREILPSGKSRAFINDTPVTLQSLVAIGGQLIDIHSQHQTLQVATTDFQFFVLDALADATPELESYKRGLEKLKTKEKELELLIASEGESKNEYDYNLFLFQELEDANLRAGEQQELVTTFETLNNVEEIQDGLSDALGILTTEEYGIADQLNTVKTRIQKIASYSSTLEELSGRLESVYFELYDIQEALTKSFEQLEADPEQLELVNQRLKLLHDLQHKHTAGSVEELLVIYDELQKKVLGIETLGEDIERLQKKIDIIKKQLDSVGQKLNGKRAKALPKLTTALETILQQLGMPNASFKASLQDVDEYLSNGKDKLEFLFSANKGGTYGELKKVASGGELSRIMLAIKTVLSRYMHLPTLIFDEIDTGVSGEIAEKMADLMLEMSANLQVFSITHLPQIAAKGQVQYKVYKEDIDEITVTQLKLLNTQDRVTEIAQMLGGTVVTESAITHAKALLNVTA